MRHLGCSLLALHAFWVVGGSTLSDSHAAAAPGPQRIESGNHARLRRAGVKQKVEEDAELTFQPPAAGLGVGSHTGVLQQPPNGAGRLEEGDVRRSLGEEPAKRPQETWQEEDPASEVGRDGDGDGGRDDGGSFLPQCYSSPAADPSEGVWVKCAGGEEACSPTRTMPGDWVARYDHNYARCTKLWSTTHSGEESTPYWTWQPAKCRLEEVSAAGFCRAMEGRKGVLLVGDSLMGQMSLTLAAVLGAELIERKDKKFDLFVACGGKLRVSHYRNDLLDTRNQSFPTMHCVEPDYSSTRCISFAGDSVLGEYDTLVVNSGAHALRGGMSEYESRMREAAATLNEAMTRLHGDDAILVVRNTSPGHWNCDSLMFTGPVDFETARELTHQGPPGYHWDELIEKNEVLEAAFDDAGGWTLMDIYSPTVLRADSHVGGGDCLHNCVPGPVDHWVTLLYNILLAELGSR